MADPIDKEYPLHRADTGELVAHHVRTKPKGFFYRQLDGKVGLPEGVETKLLHLYGWNTLNGSNRVVFVEGEKAQEALHKEGIPAVAIFGAANTPGDVALRPYIGKECILWADFDDAGVKAMEKLAERLIALGQKDIKKVDWKDDLNKGDDAHEAVARKIDIPDLLNHAVPVVVPEPEPEPAPAATSDGKPTVATQLVTLAKNLYVEIWNDGAENAYITVEIDDK